MYSTLLCQKENESDVEYWQRQNEHDKAIGLYCQSCCYRYDDCIDKDSLHPYDRAAETCPDFIPKDYYKPKSKAKCWKKRLSIDPEYIPLPDCELRHPIDWYAFAPSTVYYKVITKMKSYDYYNKEGLK
jgi:hypothetical protein